MNSKVPVISLRIFRNSSLTSCRRIQKHFPRCSALLGKLFHDIRLVETRIFGAMPTLNKKTKTFRITGTRQTHHNKRTSFRLNSKASQTCRYSVFGSSVGSYMCPCFLLTVSQKTLTSLPAVTAKLKPHQHITPPNSLDKTLADVRFKWELRYF